jgi:SAM-dependent methyltransferase
VIDFTGERLIPGQVGADLLNEHLARYVFASRLAEGARVLDAGCGAGYGSAELARHARLVVGSDIADDAISFARSHYWLPNLAFEQASCSALPHPPGSFDLITAFEVIEHLEDWRGFLSEARRVLSPGGLFLVSTPNKLVYSESRGPAGANPFHVHEFEFEEFRDELGRVFPSVSLFLENHTESIVFQPCHAASAAAAGIAGGADPESAHFFLAVCSLEAPAPAESFVFVPRAANILLERERHVALVERHIVLLQRRIAELEAERQQHVALLEGQLAELQADRERIAGLFRVQAEDLEKSNRWAEELNQQIAERRARVAALQEEIERSNRWAEELDREVRDRRARVAALQEEIEERNQWALALDTEMEERVARIQQLQQEVEERNRWAEGLNSEIAGCRETLAREQESSRRTIEEYQARLAETEAALRYIEGIHAMVRQSRWLKLSRKFGLGPAV